MAGNRRRGQLASNSGFPVGYQALTGG